MKIIIKDSRIIATASDEYTGPDEFMQVPEGFDVAKLEKYRTEQWAESPFEDPSPVVPEVITPRQGRIVLSQYGLLSAVDGYFAALTGDGAEIAKIEWEYAQEWRRDWPVLVAAATSFGLTTEQIDQMFIAAALF